MKYSTETALLLGAALAGFLFMRYRHELKNRDTLRAFTFADIPSERRGEITAESLGMQ